jgi:peroxiredoxin
MNSTTYNTIGTYLGLAVLIALLLAICGGLYSFIFMLVRWKTPQRRRHVTRLVCAVIAVPCLAGIPYAYFFLVVRPALERELMEKINAKRAAKVAEMSVVHVGDPAPGFSVTTADGDRFSLKDARGDVILINFFATWCGPCLVELPHIEQIWAEKKNNQRFRLLVIGREESIESVREFRDKYGFSFPMAADPDRRLYSLFANESIPRTLVVSPDGFVVYSKVGFYEEDLDELNAVLEAQFADLQ